MQAPEPLTAEDLAAVDAAYKPIPAFADWPREAPGAELWKNQRAELQRLKSQASQDTLNGAVQTAMRAAAWDTGAIEGLYKTDRGLTMTVATQAAAWESKISGQTPNARAYFDAQLRAYELVMDVASESQPAHEVWIRRLHEVLTAPQSTYTVHTPIGPQERPMAHGAYKDNPNHVHVGDGSIHPYAPVETTGIEMGRLVAELSSDDFMHSHPVSQASYTHYCLAAIHPFADGNGRVARAVASTYLYRAASIPLLVLADQRDAYLMSLEAADQEDYAPFVRFVADSVRSATGMVIEGLHTALAPKPEGAIATLRSLLIAQGGMTHQELDSVGRRLATEVAETLDDVVAALDLPPGVTSVPAGSSLRDPIDGYRPIHAGNGSMLNGRGIVFHASPPAAAERGVGINAVVSKSDNEAETFLLVERRERGAQPQTLSLGLGEVYPELTVAAQYRIRAFVERLIGSTLNLFAEEARKQLGQSGYAVDD